LIPVVGLKFIGQIFVKFHGLFEITQKKEKISYLPTFGLLQVVGSLNLGGPFEEIKKFVFCSIRLFVPVS
jgi:hypothetical protein